MNVVQFSVEPLLRVAQAFPATPRIMAELSRLLSDADADLAEITEHLKRDSTLAARLLRIANSAAFAQSQKVGSVEDAVALIGFKEIYRLIGAVAVDQFSGWHYPLYGFTGRRLRENALLVALLMEELAEATDEDPKTAYTTGLFRCVGKLALEKLGAEFGGIDSFQTHYHGDLLSWERHSFGIAANDATATILDHWRFPPLIAQAVAAHYQPAPSGLPLAHLLRLSAGIADRLGYGLPGENRYCAETESTYAQAGLDSSAAKPFVERATLAFAKLNQALG